MASQSTNAAPSIFSPLLAVLFIGLKLTNNIAWSWWWVLSPLWIPAVVGLGILGIYLAYVAFKSPPSRRW